MLIALSLLTGAAAQAGGEPEALAPYAGRVVYLDFWASWCGPCAQSFPWLNRMRAQYGDRLNIVAVNVDSDSTAAKAFLQRHPAHFDVLYDPAGALAERYHIDGMPSSVIVDASGHVVHQHSGFFDARSGEYEAAIRKAIDTPATTTTGSPP